MIEKEWKIFALQTNQLVDYGYFDFKTFTIYKSIPTGLLVTIKLYGEIHRYRIGLRVNENEITGILV